MDLRVAHEVMGIEWNLMKMKNLEGTQACSALEFCSFEILVSSFCFRTFELQTTKLKFANWHRGWNLHPGVHSWSL